MDTYNIFDGELEPSDEGDPEGFRARYARVGTHIGAKLLGATVYALSPGERICPYHYEYGNEEWLIVLAGNPTLRVPDGEHELRPGDTVCFPEGPEGAHDVSNRGDELVRVAMLSTKNRPDISVYPDSDKIGIWTGNEDDTRLFKRGTGVDYWEGEV